MANEAEQKQPTNIIGFSIDTTYELFSPSDLVNIIECSMVDGIYHPPINYAKLAKMKGMAAYHESALDFKKNSICSIFKPNSLLSYDDFEGFIYDYHFFGNAYLVPIKSSVGNVIKYKHVLAKYTRIGTDGTYYFIPNAINQHELKDVLHIKSYDLNQNIYGIPTYLSALLSILLNHEATMFRYKYYKNGSHAGFILSINGEISQTSIEAIKTNLQKTKNDGNFRNLLVHLPKGDKDSVQLIPISQIATKDEFVNIKNVSRDDILAVHRVPLALMSIQAQNAGGYGDIQKIATVFHQMELTPIIKKLTSKNLELNQKIFEFDSFNLQ